MKAFVTGATGFAGGHLCRALVSRRWEVRGLARKTSDTAALQALGVEVATGDIREKTTFASALRGADVVFHLAAVFREAGLSDQVYHDVNVGGTQNAIEAAAEGGAKRFVHFSTVGVHGDTGQRPADEARPLVPADDSYSRTKIAGERLARELFDKLNLSGTILRPTAGYGPGEMRYLKLFKGIRKGRFAMIGSGQTIHNLVYTDDLCEGIILAGERPEAAGETFLLGAEENVTLNDLVAKIARVLGQNGNGVKLRIPAWPVMTAAKVCEAICRPLGVEPPLHRRRVGFFTVNRAADVSKARRLLGYRSKVPLDEGLRRTAAWYESKGLL